MCGITCIFGEDRINFLNLGLKHRGPDASRTVTNGKCTMIFTRLAINDTSEDGMQPFECQPRVNCTVNLMCNGEIFNHRDLSHGDVMARMISNGTSDCECLIPLIHKHGIFRASQMIRGEFAMCWTDGDRVMASRDPFGVRPLFYTRYAKDSIAFASEAKELIGFHTRVEVFPPGHIYDSYSDTFSCYYPCYWDNKDPLDVDLNKIRTGLEEAVRIRIENTDRPVGFFLSGGLDSSLVAAIARGLTPGPIKTFSIGAPDSADLRAARKVADFLGTEHTEVHFDIEEGLRNVEEVIRSIESYDTTTVRASVPMWTLAKWVSENTDIKVIISGEGSDELFGGYLYFHHAPNVEAFSKENARRLKLIHQFDGLRADRCIAAHGLELRVPFLDVDFVDYVMSMRQDVKMVRGGMIEKWVLRKAFEGHLPDEVLWRQKDGMSDAVGYSWVDHLRETGEQYDKIFDRIYPGMRHLISEKWMPKWVEADDPSARVLKVKER
jgi:asparagine synthase (glutamine-hydrolysing)